MQRGDCKCALYDDDVHHCPRPTATHRPTPRVPLFWVSTENIRKKLKLEPGAAYGDAIALRTFKAVLEGDTVATRKVRDLPAGLSSRPRLADIAFTQLRSQGKTVLSQYWSARTGGCHFATRTSISPVASLTVAAPHSVALPFASNLQPKVPAFLAAHCPALRFTRYQPEPTGLFAGLPLA